MSVAVYTDGASRGNPGHASLGAVAYKDGVRIFSLSEYLGVNTNNYAEYKAAIEALRELKKLDLQHEKIEIFADSKLLVEQASGRWKVKHENIKPLFNELRDLLSDFDSVSFVHILREKNKEADALANKALDQALS